MGDWKGLDSGGTEQLWEPDILGDMLAVMKSHEPFSRNDHNSPIYEELESQYPAITWRNVNADGSFRPIFRKANPLTKLGLVEDLGSNACVTPLGDEVLAGVTSWEEVFVAAAKAHRERDGTPSMSFMCNAALEIPEHVFTLDDIELAISERYNPKEHNALKLIQALRDSGAMLSPRLTTRIRRVRDFMDVLVKAGAFQQVPGGWKLHKVAAAEDIGSTASTTETDARYRSDAQRLASVAANNAFGVRAIETARPRTVSVSVSSATSNPQLRALLLERANNLHEQLVIEIASVMAQLGHTALEGFSSFDVGICAEQCVLVEVKTITPANCISQLRKAIAQLPEYRWKHQSMFPANTRLVILLTEDPRPHVDDDYIKYIEEDREIEVFWKCGNEFIDATGRSFRESLARHS